MEVVKRVPLGHVYEHQGSGDEDESVALIGGTYEHGSSLLGLREIFVDGVVI